MPTLATTRLAVAYTGQAAHASAFPERGVNAADAATLAQTAIAMARQQLPPRTRVHGIVTEAGTAPNVIPDRAALDYLVRAPDRAALDLLEEKVRACFEAAAVATGCGVEVTRSMPVYDSLVVDPEITALYRSNAEVIGRSFHEVTERVVRAAGSTDMGNVSRVVPSIHPMIGLGRGAGTIHAPEFAVAARGESGDRAAIDGAIALAHTVVDVAGTTTLRNRLLEEPGTAG
jgi:amidohydrolase